MSLDSLPKKQKTSPIECLMTKELLKIKTSLLGESPKQEIQVTKDSSMWQLILQPKRLYLLDTSASTLVGDFNPKVLLLLWEISIQRALFHVGVGGRARLRGCLKLRRQVSHFPIVNLIGYVAQPTYRPVFAIHHVAQPAKRPGPG